MENEVYYEVLLGCSPPLNEKSYTAEEHYALLESVLGIYGKSIKAPVVIIGDNCLTNKALADLMGVPLIGCGCHKLNLAVKAYLARRPAVEKTIARVDKVVSQLRNLKAAGALRELTSLTPIKRNARQLDDIDSIGRADSERLKTIIPSLNDFRSIMTDLQKKGQHIGAVHETFGLMTKDYPELKDYLAADAAIAHNPLFESAVVKIINGEKDSLTVEEKDQVACFLLPSASAASATQRRPIQSRDKKTYASQLRERKRQRMTPSEEYADLRFITGTSASEERRFSSAMHVLRSTRKRLTPVNFEKLLFLKHNRHL
ncbi:hypothetical protein PHYSODRAFT_296297 [Phytophthora sojae]|uniref:HAT C-terminal dimerisation domain-containing protein n=1 Tax=Phytophthora sojae (strain P6497) TaxID=1094619 RepID=G4YRP6_PHYSP|nr:hypothetical protein PHYSODRAFT_296297 [Phytophthora sojae]EGZ24087.1 hypothetical protein PHYSODRAFT_296297 [Phytophthora sojae]|eukprot:XP_009519375.1 hypothetical protein PHYSODRAFT_296297 [Phytophthora sojae]